MKRRFFLGLAPAVLAARAAASSPVSLPTIQERIDHHAAEILDMVHGIAPAETGTISVALHDNWHPHGPIGRSWGAAAYKTVWRDHPQGRGMWIGDSTFHLHPERLSWTAC